jgi:general secretion pathway protein K
MNRRLANRGASGRPPRAQRSAALLIAMVLLTLVATLAAGMVWQQWRGVEVESAERGRAQIVWIMNGALDWARLILREDANNTKRRGIPTSLNEPWATPLAEARLSTFLAADKDNNADSGPEVFLGGSITDAQSRYNLRNPATDGKISEDELAILKRLCQYAGLSSDVADRLAEGLLASQAGTDINAALAPSRLEDLAWLGLDAASIEKLRPLAIILPEVTTVNINTASREVLAAVVGMDIASAEKLVQTRQRTPFKTLEEAQALLPDSIKLKDAGLSTTSNFFEVRGRMRLDERVMEETSLVQRRDLEMVVVQRQRAHSVLAQSP